MNEVKSQPTSRIYEALALLVAACGVAGSLYLSVGMGLKACPLCLYERTFIMATAGILLIGLLQRSEIRPGLPALLCLAPAIGGAGVAAFHVYLEATGVLECPDGVAGLGSAPLQSLAAYLLLVLLLAVACVRCGGAKRPTTTLIAVVLGAGFIVGTIGSAPPLPKPPSEPYQSPLEGCRPTFQAESK